MEQSKGYDRNEARGNGKFEEAWSWPERSFKEKSNRHPYAVSSVCAVRQRCGMIPWSNECTEEGLRPFQRSIAKRLNCRIHNSGRHAGVRWFVQRHMHDGPVHGTVDDVK